MAARQGGPGTGALGVLHRRPGVADLLLSGRDVALRVTSAANVAELQAQLDLFTGNAGVRFKQATMGQRWWRFGPLTEAECWRALEMVRSMGLEPLRGELRHARMGRWRHAVYFSAVGSPTRTSLDDGSRTCSEAFLQEVKPPPRQPPRTAFATPSSAVGSALSPHSAWAGPRSAAPQPAATPTQSEAPATRPADWPVLPHMSSPPVDPPLQRVGQCGGPPREKNLSEQPLPPPRGVSGGSLSSPPSTGISGGSRRQQSGGTQSQSRRDPWVRGTTTSY